MARIRIKFNGAVIKECYLQKNEVRFGRKPDNDIVVDHPTVSGSHGIIRRQGNTYFVEDLKSTNGVFVNGRRVEQSVLNDGDQIGVSRHIFEFLLDEQDRLPEPEPPPAPEILETTSTRDEKPTPPKADEAPTAAEPAPDSESLLTDEVSPGTPALSQSAEAPSVVLQESSPAQPLDFRTDEPDVALSDLVATPSPAEQEPPVPAENPAPATGIEPPPEPVAPGETSLAPQADLSPDVPALQPPEPEGEVKLPEPVLESHRQQLREALGLFESGQVRKGAQETAAPKPQSQSGGHPAKIGSGMLRIISGATSSQVEHKLTNLVTYLGSSDQATIKVKGVLVPKLAAAISQRPEGYFLKAVKKGYPKVNGVAIQEQVLLENGALIEIGGTSLVFYQPEAQPAKPA